MFTFSAKPWEVTKREMWMPMAASLASGLVPAAARFAWRTADGGRRPHVSSSGSVQTPVRPGTRFVGIAEVGAGAH